VTRDVTVGLATLGVVGQALAGLMLLAALAGFAGVRKPLESVRASLAGYGLWPAFVVAALATGGSLFFSEVAHYPPCELCWFQRVCMYPLAITTLLAAVFGDRRASRYLLPLPLVGGAVSAYHLLVENGVLNQSQACLISAPGGCAVKWVDEFGYVTIPTLALTGFVLAFGSLLLASLEPRARETYA
jgi:disulfide bond formation protein DsbB